MLKKMNKTKLLVFVLFFIYSSIQVACLIMNGDDFWWAMLESPFELFEGQNVNGRYFTNILTYYIVKNPIIRLFVCDMFYFLLFVLIGKIIEDKKKEKSHYPYFFSALFIFTIPLIIGSNVITWMSGFTNYVISIVLILMYILFCMPLFRGTKIEKNKLWIFYTFILGFLGTLCVENATIYILVFSVFIIVFSAIKYKTVHIANIGYIIGGIIGTAIMFINGGYFSIISESKDSYGFRHVEFSFSDIFTKIYKEIIPFFSKVFVFANIFIAVSILIMYINKYSNKKKSEIPKYSKFFVPLIISYAVYSFFTVYVINFQNMTSSYRISALETAFAFLYIIGIIYMSWFLIDFYSFLRVTLYVCSAIAMIAPFLVVSPITPRCFFGTGIFWFLTAGELSINSLSMKKLDFNKDWAKISSIAILSFFCIGYSFVNISNKYVDNLRIEYIKEQMEANTRPIELINLPYSLIAGDYIYLLDDWDGFSRFNFGKEYFSYPELVCKYYGIDESILDKKCLQISINSYFLAHDDDE